MMLTRAVCVNPAAPRLYFTPKEVDRARKRHSCYSKTIQRVQCRAASAKAVSAATTNDEDCHDGPKGSPGNDKDRNHEADYVIIGSGIGGLCCAALLAKYGYKVTVCESHYLPGGAAHSFQVKGYHFDAGPSFFLGISGESGTSPNPLKQVLDVIGETVTCAQYDKWVCYTPEGTFPCVANRDAYRDNIRRMGGVEALDQWLKLEKELEPLQRGAAMFPAAAIRSDLGVALTSARFMGLELARTAFVASQLTGPFSAVVDKVVTNKWLRSFLDLECFVLSGMLAADTLTAEMAFMFLERNSGRCAIDYPECVTGMIDHDNLTSVTVMQMGGSKGIVDALVRGIQKHGGKVLLGAHVDSIEMQGGRACGVRLRSRAASAATASQQHNASPGSQGSSRAEDSKRQVSGPGTSTSGRGGIPGKAVPLEYVQARRGVISNASGWDTQKLLPHGAGGTEWTRRAVSTPQVDSFMHLHLGIDATGLPADLDCHHLVVNDWSALEAQQNVTIISIPTIFDPSLAPPGKAAVHVYGAANEPYSIWEGLDRRSPEYLALREERSKFLWEALERVIPDVRARTEMALVGTPLTHERFLRRHRGSYGPAISAARPADGSWPGPKTPVPGLFVCGDSCMPGIGVPAAAGRRMVLQSPVMEWLTDLLAGPCA